MCGRAPAVARQPPYEGEEGILLIGALLSGGQVPVVFASRREARGARGELRSGCAGWAARRRPVPQTGASCV